MRKMAVGIVLACGAVLAACDLFKTRYEDIPPKLPETITILGEAPSDWKLRSLDGSEFVVNPHQGKKLFINIWGSWCGPCLAELPHLQALYDELNADTTIEFYFVSEEPEATVRAFVAANEYTLPFYVCDRDKPTEFNNRAYPTTYIVNSSGQIVYRMEGSAKWDHPSVIEFLRGL